MAYLGGSLELSENVFYWTLVVSLILVAVRIYAWNNATLDLNLGRRGKLALSLLIGGVEVGRPTGIPLGTPAEAGDVYRL